MAKKLCIFESTSFVFLVYLDIQRKMKKLLIKNWYCDFVVTMSFKKKNDNKLKN